MNNLYYNTAVEAQDMDFNSVDITDRYMFAYVMRNPEICKELLQYIFPEHKIDKIDYVPIDEADNPNAAQPEIEKTITAVFGQHGVRLDVYMDDGQHVYNIEMQTTTQPALEKRARYYQAQLTIDQLPRGSEYDLLRPTYVVFICKFDPFHAGLCRYTHEYICRETQQPLDDGSFMVFLNTKGTGGNVSDGMKEILRYMNNTEDYPVEDTKLDLIKRIDNAVSEAKANSEWRRSYMTYLVQQRAARLEGRQEGIEIGEKRGEQRGKIIGAIETYRELGLSDNQIKDSLIKRFNLSLAEASDFMVRPVQ